MPKTPSDATLPISSEENEKLRRWRSEFQLDYRHWSTWLEKKKLWRKFYDGDQLSTEEKEALKKRNQPEVVINKIAPRIDGVIGDFLARRVMMRARDRGTADFDVAKFVTEALRYVEDQTRFDDQESQVAEDLLVGGVGWYKVSLEFDFLEPEIRISHRRNDDIILDRRCRRRDMQDAKRLWETVWVEMEDLIELYPEHEQFIREAAGRDNKSWENDPMVGKGKSSVGDDYALSETVTSDTTIDFETFTDPKRKRVRLINVWERVKKRVEFAFHPDMAGAVQEITEFSPEERSAMNQAFPGVQIFARERWELNSGIFIINKILEDKENVRPHDSEGKFPFARAIAKVEEEDQRVPYGLVKQYIDPQKEYNKRRSKLLHKTNVNRIVAEAGAFPNNDIERVRQEAARPDGVVIYTAGKNLQIDSDKPDQADVMLLQLSQGEIEEAGPSREFLGAQDKVMSGNAIQLRQLAGQKLIRAYFAALRAARRDCFTIVLEEIQQFWTSEKLIKITDDPEAGSVVLNQRTTGPDGMPVILNNLRLGKYDIKIDEDAETPNQRSEQFQSLIQLGQIALQAGQPFPLEMMIKSSDLPNKKEWLDAIAQANQQRMQMMQLQAMAMMKAGAGSGNGQGVTPT